MEEAGLVQTKPRYRGKSPVLSVFSSLSCDPRCPFKHPFVVFFFNWSQGCSPPSLPPLPICSSAGQSYHFLPALWAAPLVYRCAPRRHLGQRKAAGRDRCRSTCQISCSGSRSQVSARRGKLIPKPQANTWRREREICPSARENRQSKERGVCFLKAGRCLWSEEKFRTFWSWRGRLKGSYRARSVENQPAASKQDR